jgi:maltose alpha-D-glucosyltransferase/alpha-amylase
MLDTPVPNVGETTNFEDLPAVLQDAIKPRYFHRALQLAERTAGMHLALASGREHESFSADKLAEEEIQAQYLSVRELLTSRFNLLRSFREILKDSIRGEADHILASEDRITEILRHLLPPDIVARKIRIHGDYHLGQILDTGDDFVVLDFEGEPDKPYVERRRKHSPLKDVAGMIRSFHYAVYASIIQELPPELAGHPRINEWADAWYQAISGAFFSRYLEAMKDSNLLPAVPARRLNLLDSYILEKAVYELGYELNNRPEWVAIPLKGITHIVRTHAKETGII